MNDMWSVQGWAIKDEYAPAVRGITDLFAEYLSGAVNGEKIKSDTNDRLVAMGRAGALRCAVCPGRHRRSPGSFERSGQPGEQCRVDGVVGFGRHFHRAGDLPDEV